ncbi:BLUF domain-containing protein [Microbacterium excoecariae]|uniref:BLUF domain-containing protein n=1 Tax=Microbacterium excoecariae TaxID=2715210 RepID=UPI00140B7098|nr:BLUF domain-containing protein [Microbacterium excoecariae]NHI16371.1 BLUF domain-containing protein [Microbacterium excoecariae]
MTSSGPVFSLAYSSVAVRPFDDLALAALLAQSREANARAGITGMLLFRAGSFVQVIEGDEAGVRALMARISRDPRHTRVRVLVEGTAPARTFADWTMGYEPITAPTAPAPVGFRNTFDDLDNLEDPALVARAVRELSLWFRVRQARRAA